MQAHKKITKPLQQHETKDQRSFFKNKILLDTLTTPSPAAIVGRDREIQELSRYLSSYNTGFVVPFISIYGKSGTGKSAAVATVCHDFEKNGTMAHRFVNLRKARSVFGCVNIILHELGGPNLKSAEGISVGLQQIEESLESTLEANPKRLFLLVVDEFDVLFQDRRGAPSDFLYSLMLMEENFRKKGRLMCTIAISNRVVADYSLDDRVKSRIGYSEIYFKPYSKIELIEILKSRQALAFSHPVDPRVLEYCAKLSSRDHGDARRAIDLLRRAGEIASAKQQQERKQAAIVSEDVDVAFEELHKDRIVEMVRTFPFQLQLVCGAIVRLSYLTDEQWHSTSTLMAQYELMNETAISDGKFKPLSRRRFAELLTELKNIGLLVSHTSSDGRHGYQARYKLTEDPELICRAIWIPEAWDRVVDLRYHREEFLAGRMFRKALSDFNKLQKNDETVATEMNDWNWNREVYGRATRKLS